MLLTIDSGNTTLSMAVMKGGRVLYRQKIDMHLAKSVFVKKWASTLRSLDKQYPLIRAVVLCSVVPSLIPSVEKIVKSTLGRSALVVGRDLTVPIKNNYGKPRQVGQDRLVVAYAAKELYGYPAVVVDLGTAMTFDVVSSSGAYEGGMIVPGMRLAAEALHTHTALLPKIHIDRPPRQLVGKDTETSMLSGIYHGYGSLCDGLIKRITSQMKRRPKVIATGGYVRLMNKFFKDSVDVIDHDLIFKGLWFIYKKASIR